MGNRQRQLKDEQKRQLNLSNLSLSIASNSVELSLKRRFRLHSFSGDFILHQILSAVLHQTLHSSSRRRILHQGDAFFIKATLHFFIASFFIKATHSSSRRRFILHRFILHRFILHQGDAFFIKATLHSSSLHSSSRRRLRVRRWL